jgi:hypothetical protein
MKDVVIFRIENLYDILFIMDYYFNCNAFNKKKKNLVSATSFVCNKNNLGELKVS